MFPKFSVLDLAPVLEGETPADAFRHSRDLIQVAEKCGSSPKDVLDFYVKM